MSRKHVLLLIILLTVSATLACNLSGSTSAGLQDGLIENYNPAAGSAQGSYEYSPEQTSILQQYGNPIRFNIILTQENRAETWYYDTKGYIAAFQNGSLVAEQNFSPIYIENLHATTYTPGQFYRGMDIDAVSASTGRNSFVLTTIDDMPEESRLMHLEGLSVGLVNGRINFVETFPSVNEISLSPEDFTRVTVDSGADPLSTDTPQNESSTSPEEAAAGQNLTPAEADSAGTHTYKVIFYVDAEEVDRKTTTVNVTFTASGMEWTEDGEILVFTRTEPDNYEFEDMGTWLYVTFIPEGPLMLYEEEGSYVEIIYTRMD